VRGSFGYTDWKQSVNSGSCIGVDPTNQRFANITSSCGDSEIVAPRSAGSGSKGSVYLNSKWQFNVGGLYQLPAGFNVAANLYGRQGYPQVNTIGLNPGDGAPLGTRTVIINNIDSKRLDTVFEGDFRIEKVLNVSSLNITLSLDIFNVANSGTVLQRNNAVVLTCDPQTHLSCVSPPAVAATPGGPTSTNQSIQEVQAPRTIRAGARLSF
jgi:hypothetical protein